MNLIQYINIDSAIVIVYILMCLIIGFYKSNKIRNIREYTLADRNFPIIFLAATLFATSICASSGIDKIGRIYNLGAVYGIPALFIFSYWIVTSFLFSNKIHKFSHCISISEVIGELYGKQALHITNFSVLIDSIGYISMQITAIGFLFEYFFKINFVIGATIGFLVFTLYSLLGGVRAVIITDTMQFMIFFIAFPMGIGILYHELGGLEKIYHNIDTSYLSIKKDNFGEFLGYLFYCLMPTVTAPNVQRMLIAKNQHQLKKVFLLVALIALLFNFIQVFAAVALKIKSPNVEPELVFYFFINNYLPIGVTGLVVVGMLAIMMSTADSWLNASSTTLSHDVIKKFFPNITPKNEVLLARISTFFISTAALILALYFKKISDLIWGIRSYS